uniref:Uncharacterized protein n=1 Tax=Rhizophora mucronata TaxID=61149 RepID=A0A2P2NFS3_RHIMU
MVEGLKNPNGSTLDLGLTRTSSKGNNSSQGSYSISLSSCWPPLYPHGKRSPGNGSCSQPPQQNCPW